VESSVLYYNSLTDDLTFCWWWLDDRQGRAIEVTSDEPLLRLMMSSTQPLPPSDDDRSSLRHRFVRLNPRFDRDETLTLLKVSNNIMCMFNFATTSLMDIIIYYLSIMCVLICTHYWRLYSVQFVSHQTSLIFLFN
jgi:hypothetical protein